jgi:prepilin-type N-terminal cleavage/methylation domain-containing protein
LSPRNSGCGERGFTLVEVLVATVVLSVGLTAMAHAFCITLLVHYDSRITSRAVLQAQGKVDELMKLNLATAAAVQLTANPAALEENVANYFDTPEPGVTRRWFVEPGPVANTRRITVRVVTQNSRGRARSTDIQTVVRQW